MLILGQDHWVPRLRNVKYQERPEWVPEWIYVEAQAAKHFYNEQWEFWVYEESRRHNCSQAVAEDACIRGLKKVLNLVKHVYGDKIGEWYEKYLDMGDIFDKVKHPDYIKKLG